MTAMFSKKTEKLLCEMAIIVDATVLQSALRKDRITRAVILNANARFVSPSYVIEEILEHREEIMLAAELDKKSFEKLLAALLKRIDIHEVSDKELLLAKEIISKVDADDIPYIALAVYLKGSEKRPVFLWSDDKDFQNITTDLRKLNCMVLTTKKLLERKIY